jgi:hypothetical protein
VLVLVLVRELTLLLQLEQMQWFREPCLRLVLLLSFEQRVLVWMSLPVLLRAWVDLLM